MRQISRACRKPFGIGSPDTTMYASPIVSTYRDKRQHFEHCTCLKTRVRFVDLLQVLAGSEPLIL